MADKVELEIDVETVKQALESLGMQFGTLVQQIQEGGPEAASAIEKLTTAVDQLKGIDPSLTDSMDKLKAAISAINTGSLEVAADILESIDGGGIGAAAQAVEGFAAATRRMGEDTRQAVMSTATYTRLVRELGTEMTNAAGFALGFGVTTGKLLSHFARLTNEGKTVADMLRTLKQEFGGFGTAVAIFGAVSVVFKQVLDGVISLFAPIVEAGEAFKKFEDQMKNLAGTMGSEVVRAIDNMAASVSTPVSVLRKNFGEFAIAARESGVSIEQSLGVFKGFATALTAAGASAKEQEAVFSTLSAGMTKGTFSFKELTKLLRDIPGGMQAAANAMGTTIAGLQKMASSGQLVSSTVLPQLAQALEQVSKAAAAEKMQNLPAILVKTKDALASLLESLARGNLGGVFDGLATGVARLRDAFSGDAFQAFARVVGDILGGALSVLSNALGGMTQGVARFIEIFRQAGAAVGGLLETLGLSQTVLNAATRVFQAIGQAVGGLGQALGLIGTAFLTYKAAALAATIATGAYGAALKLTSAAAAAATTSLLLVGGAMKAVGVAGAVLLGASLVTWFTSGANASQSLSQALGNLSGSVSRAASSSQQIKTAMDSFASSARASSQMILYQITNLNSLESAQKKATQTIHSNGQALKGLSDALDSHSRATSEARQRDQDFISAIQRNTEYLQKRQQAMQRLASSSDRYRITSDEATKSTGRSAMVMSSSASTSDVYSRAIARNAEEIAAVQFSMENAERRARAYRQSIEDARAAIEKQNAALREYGVALSEPGQRQVEYMRSLGATKEEAVKLVAAYESLKQSSGDRARALQEEATASIKLLETLKQQRDSIASLRDVREQDLKAAGKAPEVVAAAMKEFDTHIKAFDQAIGRVARDAALKQTGANLAGGFNDVASAAKDAADTVKAASGVQVDSSTAIEGALKKLTGEQTASGEATKGWGEQLTTVVGVAQQVGEVISGLGGAIAQSIGTERIAAVKTFLGTSEGWSKLGTDISKVGVSLTSAGGAITGATTSMRALSDQSTQLATDIPLLTEAMLPLNESWVAIRTELDKVNPVLSTTASEFRQIGEVAKPITAVLQSVGEAATFVKSLGDSAETASTNMGSLAEKLGESSTTLTTMKEDSSKAGEGLKLLGANADTTKGKLGDLKASAEDLITVMNKLKEAAEAALKATQDAANAGGGGGGTVQSGRYGGFSGALSETQSVAPNAFSASSPALAAGTKNTSSFLSKVPGGGIPSILHPNEAVVPLPKGRKIPVDLNLSMTGLADIIKSMPTDGGGAAKLVEPLMRLDTTMRSIDKTLSGVADAVNKGMSGVGRQIAGADSLAGDTTRAGTGISIKDFHKMLKGVGFHGGLASGDTTRSGLGGGFLGQYDNRHTPDGASSPGNGTSSRTGLGSTGGGIHITINIQTPDVEGFRRTRDQISREVSEAIANATRRLGR